jgi:hypothetical protein
MVAFFTCDKKVEALVCTPKFRLTTSKTKALTRLMQT